MRFMMIVKASPESEKSVMPTEAELAAMGKYNEELVNAGIMKSGEGLHASSKGARIRFDKKERTVVDGPFVEAKELVAGFWIIEVKDKAEAVAWAKKIPFEEGEVELRQIAESEDFASADPSGELMKKENELRARLENQNK